MSSGVLKLPIIPPKPPPPAADQLRHRELRAGQDLREADRRDRQDQARGPEQPLHHEPVAQRADQRGDDDAR